MAAHKRLGIHWGETGFSFVEVVRESPALTAFVPFSEPGHVIGIKNMSQDIALLDVLQKTVRNKGFSTTETYLSLPSKDILIRWFLIPWMKTSEIQDVVSFEAKKYIPFDIEDITYTYYPITINKDGGRQIGILFVGIRKATFEKYVNVLIQSGLNVVYSEPAPMSLVRALVFKRQIDLAQVTAILRVAEDTGEIIITSKGHVKFIRDFKINAPDYFTDATAVKASPQEMEDVLRARTFNEVRISFEFFARQYGEEGVNKIIILASGLKQSFWAGLSEDMGVPVSIIDPLQEIGPGEGMNMGGVNAFGAALSGNVASVIDFNLSEKSSQQVSLKKEEMSQKNRLLILPIIIGVACASFIALIFFISGLSLEKFRAEVDAVAQRVGAQAGMTVQVLDDKRSLEEKKFQALKSLPLKGRLTPLIVHLVKSLPDGFWLEAIEGSFKDSTSGGRETLRKTLDPNETLDPVFNKMTTMASMTIVGYVYLNDSNAEFGAANNFVNVLRKDDLFSAHFKNIKLVSLRSDSYVNTKATSFKISCEAK